MKKIVMFFVSLIIATCAAGVAAETSEEITWCEAPETLETSGAIETTEGTETAATSNVECWGSYSECQYLAEEFYWAECMTDAFLWAASICDNEWEQTCYINCLDSITYSGCMYDNTCSEIFYECLSLGCPGGGWGYDHFIFTCMMHYLGYASIECNTAKELYLIECACNE